MADLSDEEEPSQASMLLDYLKELCEGEFKEFKWHLTRRVLKDFPPIPKGEVKDLDKMDAVDLMIKTYCSEGALKIMLKILKKMNQHELAKRLEAELQKLIPRLTCGGPEPKEMPPSSAMLSRKFSPSPASSTGLTGGFPKFQEPATLTTGHVDHSETIFKMDRPLLEVSPTYETSSTNGGPEGQERGSRGIHSGYSGVQMEIERPQCSAPLPMRHNQSFSQPMSLGGGLFPPHRSEPSSAVPPVDLYRCLLCMGPLKDPVSTHCGHRFCRQCISSYWARSSLEGSYACPQCRKRSWTQPVLHDRPARAGFMQNLQEGAFDPPPLALAPAPNSTGPGEVIFNHPPRFGDLQSYRAAESGWTSSSAPYFNSPPAGAWTHGPLMPLQSLHQPGEATGGWPNLCALHNLALEGFCETDRTLVCRVCAEQSHRGHRIVTQAAQGLDPQIRSTSDASSVLTQTLATLEEEEFQRFKRNLSQDYPGCFGGMMEEGDVERVVRRILQSCGSEEGLKISLHVLGKYNQDSHPQNLKHIKVQKNLKMKLKKRFECIFEVIAKQGKTIFLNDIFTELYITEGGSGGVNNEHEVRQIETASKRQPMKETPIKCNDIFKPLPGQRKHIRAVLTKGIAGIGKTVSVQKFVLDWAEGEANQDLNFIFTLPFRDLNVLKGQKYSLMQLLHQYFPETKSIDTIECSKLKVLFIFDGLDECRIPLNFRDSEVWCDVTETTSIDVLLTNLINGNMLPSALLWITTRPAAAGLIPQDCIQQLTEVRGFNDPQKEEYFTKRFCDQTLARKIISHIKSSRSLHIMCHIPVFCWISATVLEKLMTEADSGEIPKTLTQMYTHFLLIQINIKNQKYQGTRETNAKKLSESDKEIILKLGKLAFQQLEKGNLIFYGEDLKECGIDVGEASVHSGVCTEIFKEELGLYQEKVYCFVHLSIQEYLAALYVFYQCTQENKNAIDPEWAWNEQLNTDNMEEEIMESDQAELYPDFMENGPDGFNSDSMEKGVDTPNPDNMENDQAEEKCSSGEDEDEDEDMCYFVDDDDEMEVPFSTPLSDIHMLAVDKALESKNGHLDLFLRFLLGISLETNQALLKDLLTPVNSSETIMVTASNIKEKIKEESSAERTINLLHCLNELNDNSLVEEMQSALKTGKLSDKVLEPHQCSALAYVFLMSEEVLDEFDLKTYNTEDLGFERLVPVVKICQRAKMDSCNLPGDSCETIASALMATNSHLVELDLRYNSYVEDAGVKLLCAGLISRHCRLQRLALAGCQITEAGCKDLASALRSNPSHLTELDLSHNVIGDSGANLLFVELKTPNCKVEKLWLGNCNLTQACCAEMASVLKSQNSHLKELELRDNDLQDAGVTALSAGLNDPECELEIFGLSGCGVTEGGSISLSLAVCSQSSRLRELDLTYNHLGESGVRLLSAALEDPNRKLENLQIDHGGECRNRKGMLKYACRLSLDPDTANRLLILSEGNTKATRGLEEQPYPDHPERFKRKGRVLCREGLSGRCYWEVEWTEKSVTVGVAHKDTSREDDMYVKMEDKSYTLQTSGDSFYVVSNEKMTSLRAPKSKFQRVGLYLDWPAGLLSFYNASSDTVSLLHTLHTTFTEPLYPVFTVYEDSSMTLCMLEKG